MTVNHLKQFVNPKDGTHKQGIERVWVKRKAILKRLRRAYDITTRTS